MKEYGLHKLKLRFGPQHKDLLWAVQADSGRAYEVQVLDERGRDHDVSGLSLSFYVSDGVDVGRVDAKIIDAKKGLFLVEPPNGLFKTPGTHRAQFALKDADGKLVQSRIFDIHIEASLANGATVGRNVIVDFGRIDKAVELLDRHGESLAETEAVLDRLETGTKKAAEADAMLQAAIKRVEQADGILKGLDGAPGPQGPPGKDGDPLTIVNDLTTGGADKALSAE